MRLSSPPPPAGPPALLCERGRRVRSFYPSRQEAEASELQAGLLCMFLLPLTTSVSSTLAEIAIEEGIAEPERAPRPRGPQDVRREL
jgi:hypothetical protein